MATITEDYVSFETAKLLNEKGFSGECNKVAHQDTKNEYYFGNYSDDLKGRLLPVPTIQMAMRWLREVHHIHIRLLNSSDESYRYEIYPMKGKYRNKCFADNRYYDCYEQACEAACIHALKNLI